MWELSPDLRAELVMVGLAFVLSAAIGAEREYHRKDAGLRTHVLVGVGAALFAVVSAYGFAAVTGERPGDPTRIAAQIVSGVGFLGAGVILTRGHVVHGLTTAATIWLVAAVGTASGAGLPIFAIAVTVGYLVLLPLVSVISERMPKSPEVSTIVLRYLDGRDALHSVFATAARLRCRGSVLSSDVVAQGLTEVRLEFIGRHDKQELVAALTPLEGVQRVVLVEESSQ